MIRIVLSIFLISSFQTVVPSQGNAEVLEWTLRHEHGVTVYVKFFSKTLNNVWPAGGNAYVIGDAKNHTQPLSCRRGEQICFGGFNADRSLFWGVGEAGTKACSTCCRVCGEYYTDVDVMN